MRVSELVTIDQIESWNNGDIITIKAGTGMGKSYFIKNNLYAIAKRDNEKILFLIHRTNCVNQFKEEIIRDGKEDTIHIRTYQFIEAAIKYNKPVKLSKYKYIVCDEFHYFIQDASFNKTTDMSLDSILKQNNSIRIFMSATGEVIQKYFKYKKINTIDYKLKSNYDHIKALTFFNKDDTLHTFINEAIKSKQKAIFFIQSAEKAYELYTEYKEYCLFNCSKDNDKFYKFVDKDKINDMLTNEKFNELILITTTCMDAGVNIIDNELKHIVCDIKEIGAIIQCIGRKRINENDNELYVYIKSVNNHQLGWMKAQIGKKLEMAAYLKKHTPEAYVNKYKRENDNSYIVYDEVLPNGGITKKINALMYCKSLFDMAQIDIMLTRGKYGYCKLIAEVFGYGNQDEGYRYRLIEEESKVIELENYLENIVGKRLYKDDQKELIDKIDLRVNRKQQKSYKKLNDGLEMLKLPYVIVKDIDKRRVTDDGTENPFRDKTYWMIVRSLG